MSLLWVIGLSTRLTIIVQLQEWQLVLSILTLVISILSTAIGLMRYAVREINRRMDVWIEITERRRKDGLRQLRAELTAHLEEIVNGRANTYGRDGGTSEDAD